MDVRLSPEQVARRDSAARVVDRLGPHAVGELDDPERAAHGAGDDTWLKVYLYSRAQSVMGGTSQIPRNLVAHRILELPTS